VALALGAGVAAAAADPTQPHAPQMQFTPPAPGSYALQRIQRIAPALVLDANGRVRTLAELTRGKVTLLTFFYTYCTDPLGCPYARELMTGLRERLLQMSHVAGRVQFLSISFDPTHDTPTAMRAHAATVPADARLPWHFVTTRSVAELLPLLDDFGQDVQVERDAAGRPTRTINHALKLFLIDAGGSVREIYALDYLHPPMMVNDVLTLLLETGRAP